MRPSRVLLVIGLLLAGAAWSEPAPPVSAEATASPHQFSFFTGGDALVFLSNARTQGGFGADIGLRDTLQDRYILQADLHYLTVLGSVGALRLGAGIQRQGTWRPAALLTLTTLFGDRLVFLTPDHPNPVTGPAVALGVNIAPARFSAGNTQISVFELGVGLGLELPGVGVSYHVRLLEISVAL